MSFTFGCKSSHPEGDGGDGEVEEEDEPADQ